MAKHWQVELDMVEKCSKGPNKKTIWLGRLAKLKIDILMKKFKDQEWLAYLLGDDYKVADLFIPDQAASAAHVGNIECEEYNELRVIGAMHSHHTMGSNFSGHDHDFVNSNHNISLLVSRERSNLVITGQVRIEVPCGALYIVPADVKLDLEVDGFNKKEFVEEIDKKVNPPKVFGSGCTQTICYCGNCFPSTEENPIPIHMRTFPSHSAGCRCSGCFNDIQAWNKKLRQKQGWDTRSNVTVTRKSLESINTDDAWICEECSKINYESDGEKLKECVWCDTPRIQEESTIEVLIDDIKEDLDYLDNLLVDVDQGNGTQFMNKKYADIEKYLAEEQILDKALQKVSKYLFLVKKYDGGEYKKDLDHFIGQIAVDYAESENKISDEILSIILELEDQLEEKNIEK